MGKVVGLTFEVEKSAKLACPYCGKEYITEDNLNKHIKDKHGASIESGDKNAGN